MRTQSVKIIFDNVALLFIMMNNLENRNYNQ